MVLVALALAGSTWHVRDRFSESRATPAAAVGKARAADIAASAAPAVEALAADRADELGKLAGQAEKFNKMAATPPVAEFVVASYNVLGASHTGGRGGRRHMADGVSRVTRAGQVMLDRKVDVAGLQEFQQSQRVAFARAFGDTYDMYPALHASRRFGQNSVVWRKDRFELVQGGAVSYPYFSGRGRPYPQILLREKRTGVQFWITSYHNPASNAGYGNQARNRSRALGLQIANANKLLEDSKRPMIITGDMNARSDYVCPMVAQTPMRPAQGGGCAAPHQGIDWVMGSTPQVEFGDYLHDLTTRRGGMSDHPLILATARVTGLPDDRREAEDPWSQAPRADR